MAFHKKKTLDLVEIQKKFGINKSYIDCCPVSKEELEKIYQDYEPEEFETIKGEILTILNEKLTKQVHSVRCRIKDPDHLIEKVIRNSAENPDKYKNISVDNYNRIITDLVGVRVIILDKRDWKDVHKSLLSIFNVDPDRYPKNPEDLVSNYDKYNNVETEKSNGKKINAIDEALKYSYHAEKPIVYITSEDDRYLYVDDNLKVDTSKTHYRSIHYIIKYRNIYFEIQVRTLFEEGWLEFDHRIKYPYDRNNIKKKAYARVLNNLALAADELISFYDENDFMQSDKEKLEKEEKGGDDTTIVECAEEQSLERKMIDLF